MTAALVVQAADDRLDRKEKCPRADGAFDEFIFFPEFCCLFIDGVSQDAADSDRFRRVDNSAKRMLKQIQPETTSLIGKVTRESSDYDYWNGVRQTVFSKRLRKFAALDCSGRQTVIANYGLALAGNIRACSSPFAGDCPDLEPIVQSFIAAIESDEVMRGVQRRGRRNPPALRRMIRYVCQSGLRFISALSFAPAGGGLSNALINAPYFSLSSTNSL
jgi:hypothetical protein